MRHADREARPARPRRLTRRRLLAGLGAGLLAVPAAGAAGLVTVRERGPSVASILPPAAGSPATPACPALPPAAPQAAAAAPGDAGVRLVVPDGPVLVDAPLVLRVEGLAPRQAVTLRAQLGDSFNQHWEAWATFRADGRGVVDVAAQAPEDGTYTDADPLGLVWSARPTGDPARAIAYFDLTLAPQPLRLAAEVEGAAAATATVERRTVAPGGVAREVYEASLFGRLYHPAGGDPAPAVLVLGGSEGGLTTVSTRPAALLAARGYAALALAYCGVGTLPRAWSACRWSTSRGRSPGSGASRRRAATAWQCWARRAAANWRSCWARSTRGSWRRSATSGAGQPPRPAPARIGRPGRIGARRCRGGAIRAWASGARRSPSSGRTDRCCSSPARTTGSGIRPRAPRSRPAGCVAPSAPTRMNTSAIPARVTCCARPPYRRR